MKTARENLEALRSSSGEASEMAAAAASVEHDALVKAQANLDAIQKEVESLKVEHAQALAEAQEKITRLEAEEQELKEKFEESDVARWEAMEEKDKAEGALDHTKTELSALERALAKEKALVEEARQAAQAKEEEVALHAEASAKAHAEELSAASLRYDELSARYKALEDELAAARLAIEKANEESAVSAGKHLAEIEELKNSHQTVLAEMSDKIVSIKTELEVSLSFCTVSA